MADILCDGNTKVQWVPAIEDITAPTLDEITATDSISLEDLITADGLVGFEADTAEVPTDRLSSTFDTKMPGRASFSGTLFRLIKQDGTDTTYDTLVRNTSGFIVVRRDTSRTIAFADVDKVEVYPVTCGETRLLQPEANSLRRYEVPVMISPEPSLRSVVGATPSP